MDKLPKPNGLEITLPWPPTVNTYYRMVTIDGSARMLISAQGRSYARAVEAIAGGVGRIDGEVAVEIAVHLPDHRKRDIDNLLKASLDALTKAGVWRDDSQIKDLRIRVAGMDRPHGRLEVTITEAEQLLF